MKILLLKFWALKGMLQSEGCYLLQFFMFTMLNSFLDSKDDIDEGSI